MAATTARCTAMPDAPNTRVPHVDPATDRWWLPITHNDGEWWAEMLGFGDVAVLPAGGRWARHRALPEGAVPLMRVDSAQWLLAEQAERGRAAFVDLGVQHAHAMEELHGLRAAAALRSRPPVTAEAVAESLANALDTTEVAAASEGRNALGTSSNVWDAVATLRWLRRNIDGVDQRALARAENIAEDAAAKLRTQERDDDRLADRVIQTACGVQGAAAPTPTAMRKAVKLAITRTREAERASSAPAKEEGDAE